MSWSDRANAAIYEVHRTLPDGTSLKDRTAAVDAAYPFGERAHHPYKAWLKARRAYLVKFGHRPRSKAVPESPMERMMRRAGLPAEAPVGIAAARPLGIGQREEGGCRDA